MNNTLRDLNSNLKESEIKNKKDISKTIISKNNNDIYNYIDEYDMNKDKDKDKEKENENEVNDYNDFNNYDINNDNNTKEEINNDINNYNDNSNIDNDNNIDNYDENKSDDLDIEEINNENEIKEKEEESPKKKKKKSTSKKKKKGKKSKEKLNVNEIINGELKVQVNNIENVMIPKTIYTPCSFSLYCSIEGIDMVLKSREVVTEDLRNVVFNWATRVLLKKKTLKDLSCKCNINLSVEQKNKNISLGNCEFEWRKCLLKSNWDKFAINETFQVLTDRKYKKIPMGNIKILAKFIPFGSKNSNYNKNGKKKKTPTNLNGIAEEPSHNSSISIKDNKSEIHESINNDNNINNINDNNNDYDINNNNDNDNNNYDINNNIDNGNIENNENEENYENEFNNVDDNKIEDNKIEDSINNDNANNNDDYQEENTGKNLLKEFDLEITSVDNINHLINKGYYLTISAMEDGEEQEKISKDKGNLKEILSKLPYTTDFSVYSYKNNKKLKIILYLKDEEDNEIGKLPIILSNKESHLEKNGKFTFKTIDENKQYMFFLKITINTVED